MVLDDPQAPPVVVLDKLTYAGNPENLADRRDDPRLTFIKGDICDRPLVDELLKEHRPRGIVHFAAESHVDRSILDSSPFIRTNVVGTQTLLDAARSAGIERFVQVSTDEVYGSLGPTGLFTEETPLDPSSPYSASKAAGDLLAIAAYRTFGLPVLITRCSNNYGPYQFPEKLIPLFLSNAAEDQPLPVYGTGENVRDWIHVLDHCRGVLAALTRGSPGEVYNFGGRCELTNLELTRRLLDALGKPHSLIRFVEDRPGHDHRYAIDCTKAERELGWQPAIPIEEGLADTIRWYAEHRDWVARVRSGEYRTFYEQQYEPRLGR